jgi:N-acetylglucosaminyldiphosphoundecaprenol N-acetyl-beta-D-mannosaminyltransferase
MHRAALLGYDVCTAGSETIVGWLLERLAARGATHIVTLNPEIVVRSRQSPELQRVIVSADLVLPDGIGIVWALRLLAGVSARRYSGIDLTSDLLGVLAKRGGRAYLLGGVEGVAKAAAVKLTAQYPGLTISGCQHGFFGPEEGAQIASQIASSKSDLLLVGMGCPRQEGFIAMHGASMSCPLMVGVGGSLDVFAGRVRRAPAGFQRAGLEWLWRAVSDPTRWRRNIALLSFVSLVLREKFTAGVRRKND